MKRPEMFSSPIRVNLHQFGNCFYPIAITSSTNSNPSDYGHTHLQKSLDKFSWGRRGFHNKKTNCCVREGSFTVTVKNMCLWVQCCYSCHAPDIFGLGGNCSSLFIFLSHHSSILIFFVFLCLLEETLLPLWPKFLFFSLYLSFWLPIFHFVL